MPVGVIVIGRQWEPEAERAGDRQAPGALGARITRVRPFSGVLRSFRSSGMERSDGEEASLGSPPPPIPRAPRVPRAPKRSEHSRFHLSWPRGVGHSFPSLRAHSMTARCPWEHGLKPGFRPDSSPQSSRPLRASRGGATWPSRPCHCGGPGRPHGTRTSDAAH